jgi:DNA-binding SARP family transcriptional activator/Tfp pilus assembly protein PilF/TolB-like protein
MITVRLLGSVDIRDAGGNELQTLLRQPKRVALLSYLAAAVPRGFHRRDTLMGLFWPESTQDHARNALSQALHVLRHELGQAAIVTRGEGEVALSEDAVSVDVWEFETALTAGDLKSAVSLYRGPLLTGLAIKASAEFDHWLDAARDRLAQSYADSLERLAEAVAKRGERHEAVAWWRRLVEHDPYSTHVTVCLMRALDAAGDRAGAMKQAERHTALLRKELAAEPSPEVVAYAERLRSEPVPHVTDHPLTDRVVAASAARPTAVDRVAKRRWMTAGAAVALAAIIAAIALIAALPRGSGLALDPRRVAVAPFENLTGEDSLNVHGQVAASWITDGLQQIDFLSVVPWMAVQREASAREAENPLRELAEVTGAGLLVSGSYSRSGDSLRFRADITDAVGMELLHSVPPVTGRLANPEAAFAELGKRVAGALAVTLDTVSDRIVSRSLRQPTFAAYSEWVTGNDLFVRGRFDEAIEHLTRAYELDSSFLQALLYAAVAHGNRGRNAAADSLLEIVEQARDQLSGHDRQFLAYYQAVLQGNLLEASRVSRELALAEGSSRWRYVSGYDALVINDPQEVIEEFEKIDPTKGKMKEWLGYWGVLTEARHMLGDHHRELRDARRGREQHPDQLAAFSFEARALAALGHVDEARVLFEELLLLPADPDWGHAYPVVLAALCLRAHGDPDAAQWAFQLAVDRLWAHSPDTDERSNHQYNLGQTLYWSGRWEEAREVFLQLVTDSPDNVDYVGHLGVVHARLGNTIEASRISDELAALDRPYLWGSNIRWQARIAALCGDRERAVELLRRAFNEGLEYGIWLHRDIDFEPLRDSPPFQELVRPKG